MQDINQDLWEVGADFICITTNLTVYSTPEGPKNPMGAGCAREAVERFPGIDLVYGRHLWNAGPQKHRPTLLRPQVVAFPVKWRVETNASLGLIETSLHELLLMVSAEDIKIALPRPGCGYGGLRYEEVRPVLEKLVGDDDRFLIVDYPKGVAHG